MYGKKYISFVNYKYFNFPFIKRNITVFLRFSRLNYFITVKYMFCKSCKIRSTATVRDFVVMCILFPSDKFYNNSALLIFLQLFTKNYVQYYTALNLLLSGCYLHDFTMWKTYFCPFMIVLKKLRGFRAKDLIIMATLTFVSFILIWILFDNLNIE